MYFMNSWSIGILFTLCRQSVFRKNRDSGKQNSVKGNPSKLDRGEMWFGVTGFDETMCRKKVTGRYWIPRSVDQRTVIRRERSAKTNLAKKDSAKRFSTKLLIKMAVDKTRFYSAGSKKNSAKCNSAKDCRRTHTEQTCMKHVGYTYYIHLR